MVMLFHTGFEAGNLSRMTIFAGTAIADNAVVKSGAYSLKLTAAAQVGHTFTATQELYSRVWLRQDNGTRNMSIGFFEGGTCHVSIDATNLNAWEARRGPWGGGIIGTGGAWVALTWCLVEVYLKVDDLAGVCQVKIDGGPALAIDFAGDTRNGGVTGLVDAVRVISQGANVWADDLAICNPAAGKNTTWLGNGAGRLVQVNGNGDVIQLTPSAGANWDCVDEIPPTSAAYTFQNTVDLYDLYTAAAGAGLTDASLINCLTVVDNAQLSAPGAGNARAGLKTGGAESWAAADTGLTDANERPVEYLKEYKAGVAAWTKADLDAIQLGAKVR